MGGRSFGGGRTGRDSTGESAGGNRGGRAGLGRTNLRNGGGGGSRRGGLDGEVEGMSPNINDLDEHETLKNNTSTKQETNTVTVQQSIDEYQAHLTRIKKANLDRNVKIQPVEERKKGKKGKSKKTDKPNINVPQEIPKEIEQSKETKISEVDMESKETKLSEVEMECLVKDEVCDAMEENEESGESPEDSKDNIELNSQKHLGLESEIVIGPSNLTKDKEDTTDSTKDSKSSSDQENAKADTLKKFKKKSKGKFRLTTKTNKSKKFDVVQPDSYIKTLNKAIETGSISLNEEQSLSLRKTERERPLSKRLLQKKLLRTKLKELGKKLLEESGKNAVMKTVNLKGLTRSIGDQIINTTTKCEGTSTSALEDNKENEGSIKANGSDKSKEAGDFSKTESSASSSEVPDSDEMVEECLYKDECARKFSSYFSMMRHVAFFHRPETTAELMKLKLKKQIA